MLILVFETRKVFLYGWRLELMLDPLMQGRVKRVHAEKYLGTLVIGEPWVSEIKVFPRYAYHSACVNYGRQQTQGH